MALSKHRSAGSHPVQLLIVFICVVASLLALPAYAQYWHVLPSLADSDAASAGFSNDQKKVFFIRRDAGIANVWSTVIADKYGGIIAGPKNTPTQVTKFTDRGIIRFLHLLTRPEIVFMRAGESGKDFHIYRMKDDGSEQPQDITPGAEGITNTIVGASYNGRFIYYSSNAVHRDKVDVYRYDTQQFTTDLVFPNDKDYDVIAWTRDQNKLLMEDSSSNALILYDIETTMRTPVSVNSGSKISAVSFNPINQNIETFNILDPKPLPIPFDYSMNCKYVLYWTQGKWSVKEATNPTASALPLPEGSRPIAISSKETLVVYLESSKLYLYDSTKNASAELGTVR